MAARGALARTKVRDTDESAVQLGAPEVLDDHNLDRPVDGLGEFVADEEGLEADD